MLENKSVSQQIQESNCVTTPQFNNFSNHKNMYQLYDCYEQSQAQPIQIPDESNYTFQQKSSLFQKANTFISGFMSKFPPKKEEKIYNPLTGNKQFDDFMGKLPWGSTTVFRSDNPEFVKQVCNRYIASAIFDNPYNQKIAFIDQMRLYSAQLQEQFLGNDWDQTIKTQMNNINYSQCQNDYQTLGSLIMQVRNYQKREKNLRLIMISVNDVINFGNEINPKVPQNQMEIEAFDQFIQKMKKLEEVLQIENQRCPIVLLCQRDNNCNNQSIAAPEQEINVPIMDVHTLIDATTVPQKDQVQEGNDIQGQQQKQKYVIKNSKSPTITKDFLKFQF